MCRQHRVREHAPGSSTVTCTLGTLLNGGNATITMVMTASTMGTFNNHVAVTSNETDSNLANNSADESTTSRQGANLIDHQKRIAESGFERRSFDLYVGCWECRAGDQRHDDGCRHATTGTTFVSATASQGTCTNASGTVTCSLGSLASGASGTVTIAVTPTVVGTLSNTATVSGSEPDPNLSDNSATATTTVSAVADLTITKTHTGNFTAGQPAQFMF